MSSSKKETDLDESVICLDTSNDITIDSDTDTTNQSVTEIENFEKTLPPGVAPEGFIIIDETSETPSFRVTDTKSRDANNEETPKPMFKIVFKDEIVSRLYKKRVRDFFHRLVSAESKDDDADTKNLVLEIWNKKTGRKRSHDHLEAETKSNGRDTEGDDGNLLFRIEKRPTLHDRLDVPTYGTKFERILESMSDSTRSEEKSDKAACRPSMNCFNCMGNHSIRDCPEPRNQMAISKNRSEFAARAMQKVGRYHVENDGKYERFVPGQISDELKRALGIRDNELPQHIYRMRMLGYPPGWLKEARLQHSGMNLYDSDGTREADPMEEPGQIVEEGDKDLYDVKKIREFPGFNVRPPSGTREEDRRYWKSERYTANSKESLLSMIHSKKVDGYKRKKLKRNATNSIRPDEIVASEMDVDCLEDNAVEIVSTSGLFIPPLPKSLTKPPLPSDLEEGAIDSPKTLHLDLEAGASPIHADSPSLADLERRKKQLLEELEDSNSSSAPATPASSKTERGERGEEQQQESTISQSDEETRTVTSMCAVSTPSRGTVKSVNLGTPILPSTSPYSKLPSVENFAKDVCELINFENLPDSTGKYEQMSGIIQKVRETLATIQQD